MTTYNTGNPIGSNDPKDFSDNAENIDVAVNDVTALTWVDRLNQTRLTLAGLEDRAATGEKRYDTKVQMDATTGTAGSSARVLNDPVAANNGLYTWENGAWEKSANDPLAGYFNLNSLTINADKDFPMKRMVRAGSDFGIRAEVRAAFLGLIFTGADPLYYYRIAYIKNGSTALPGDPQGIRVEKCLISTFETTGAAITIHSETTDPGLNLDYEVGGLQYRRIEMAQDAGVFMEVWIDVDKLPAYGSFLAMASNSQAGYNWITDPVNYRAADSGGVDIDLDSQTINVDKDFPMVAVERGGTAPLDVHQSLKAALVDGWVDNARPGYLYRVGYFGNGILIGDVKNYGFSVYRIPVSRLAEGYQETINSYLDTQVSFTPDRAKGGVQTYEFSCLTDPETRINLSFDVDKLPPDGTAIVSAAATHSGYNSIISPSKYIIDMHDEFIEGDTLVDWNVETGKLIVAYKSGSKWYNVRFQRKSINQTFTILGFGYDEAYRPTLNNIFPVQYAPLFSRTEAASDWVAPMTFSLVSGGDAGATTAIYTGGSHGTDNAAGDPTSEMKVMEIFVDDVRLDLTRNLTRKLCKTVKVLTKQDVQAYNTIISKRTALEEYVRFDISSKGVHIHKKAKALFDLSFTADNACQVYMAGLTPQSINTYLFWGGSQTARATMTNGVAFTSGPKSQFPNCLGVSIRHSAAGEFNAWTDPTFGLGTRPSLLPTEELFRFDGDGKIYPRLCSPTSPFNISAGETYEWRGGYSWGMPTITENFDCLQQTQMGDVMVKKDGSYIIV